MTREMELHHQLYEMMMRSQYWTPERMREHQQTQLAQLLHHARRTTPFYANRLDAVLRPDGTVDWARWGDIPVVTRADLQDAHEAMQARELPPGHGETQIVESSGSTGRPISVRQVSIAAMAASTANARSYSWHGVDISRIMVCLYGDDPAVGRPEAPVVHERWGPPVLHGPVGGRQFDLNLATPPEDVLAFMAAHKPSYLNGLTTRLAVLAHEAIRLGYDIKLDAVLPRGETVTPMQRKLFTDAFGARTIPIYSSQETHHVACICPDCGQYHVNAELMLVEVLDDDGWPVAQGSSGRVVITPFYGTAQPLIRYQIGDVAKVGEPCSGGRTLPSLKGIVGRIAHMFRLPGGGRVLPNVADEDVLALGAEIWQLAQVGERQLEFRYVPGRTPGDEAWFAERLQRQLHPDFAVRFVPLAPEHFRNRRKYVPYVCELPAET